MEKQTFSLGVGYWPRRRGVGAEHILCSWGEADLGALRDEFAHIVELGFDTVRLELRWAELFPTARLATAALHGLERALDRAADLGLRAVIATLGGSLGGALHLPEWAVGYRLAADAARALRLGPPVLSVPSDQPDVLAGDRYLREPPRDLYREAELLDAQRRLLAETVGNFAGHPAAAAWLLGADLERSRRPASARAAGDWWSALMDHASGLGARSLVGQVSPLGLGRADMLRPAQIAAASAHVAVSAAPLPPLPAQVAGEVEAARFVHALTAGLLRAAGETRPVMVTDLGAATEAAGASGVVAGELFGRPARLALVSEERQATFVETALAALHRDGAAGVWLAAYADMRPEHWRIPPADRSWWARTAGIVTPDGREKPAAAAVRAFAAHLRSDTLPLPSAPPALPLDPERHWHSPAASFAGLWKAWFEQ